MTRIFLRVTDQRLAVFVPFRTESRITQARVFLRLHSDISKRIISHHVDKNVRAF